MRNQSAGRLDPVTVGKRLGLCAAALAGTAATATNANATVITVNTPIVIPQTTSGIYLNLLTGASGTSGSSVTGWDFNPYLSNSGTQLGFYWPSSTTSSGGVATAISAGVYLDLAPGTVVGSGSVFTRAINNTASFRTSGTHILGFRFLNETTGVVDFGYMSITTTGTTGFPATINGWSYDDSGASITVSAVPEPASGLMLSLGALALGAVQLRRIRRQQREGKLH